MLISTEQSEAIDLISSLTGDPRETILKRIHEYTKSATALAILIEIDQAIKPKEIKQC